LRRDNTVRAHWCRKEEQYEEEEGSVRAYRIAEEEEDRESIPVDTVREYRCLTKA